MLTPRNTLMPSSGCHAGIIEGGGACPFNRTNEKKEPKANSAYTSKFMAEVLLPMTVPLTRYYERMLDDCVICGCGARTMG